MGEEQKAKLTALYNKALAEYSFWQKQYDQNRQTEDIIALAQYYGQLCGIANAARACGLPDLREQLDSMEARIYPTDFE